MLTPEERASIEADLHARDRWTRARALEEAAKVAEDNPVAHGVLIAAKIRALKEEK